MPEGKVSRFVSRFYIMPEKAARKAGIKMFRME